jgi:L-2-hydroxyglutarate oxidase LhgO
VVGAGVIGLACAAACARAGRSVVVLEAEAGIARGITSRNSEVVHAGLYSPPESLKTRLCIAGRRALYPWCEARRVPHRRLGKLVVATSESETATIEALHARALANGVEGLALIGRAAVSDLEPEVAAHAALHSTQTGIVDAHAFCLALEAEAEAAGAVVLCERRVEALAPRSFGWQVALRDGAGRAESIDAGCVVDAAGLDADALAERAGLDVDALGWRLHPCKGDYFALAPGARLQLARLVYPVPATAGLGIHVTLDLAGRVRFGPDAEYVEAGRVASAGDSARAVGDAARRFAVDPAKAAVFRAAVARYLPGLAEAELVPAYAGIRPKLAGPGEAFRDFVVEEASGHGAPGFIACIGIESPGLTAALALGDRVASLVG